MIYSIGLTGNIASGKTSAAEIFSNLGIKVLSADKISRELTAKNTTAYKEILAHFGSMVVLENNELNRRILRDLIFTKPDERLWLENLLHPLIRQQLKKELNLCTTPYCIVEIPLLIDKKSYPYLNKILVITAPLDIQIERVMKRDHCTKEQALAILSAQPDTDIRLKIADDVIINDSGLDNLKQAVTNLHFKYLDLAQQMETSQ